VDSKSYFFSHHRFKRERERERERETPHNTTLSSLLLPAL
jgi:hypothetical protein